MEHSDHRMVLRALSILWPNQTQFLSLYQWNDLGYMFLKYVAKMHLILILSKFSGQIGPKPKRFVFHSTI
jgi:hypothetical protein